MNLGGRGRWWWAWNFTLGSVGKTCEERKEEKDGFFSEFYSFCSWNKIWMREKMAGLNISGLWAPMGLRLQVLGNLTCGPRMQSAKNCSLKNLVSKKYIIYMVWRLWKSCTDLSVKRLFYPFGWKTGFWGFKHGRNDMKVVGTNKTYQKRSKLEFFENKNNSPTLTRAAQGIPRHVRLSLNTLKIPQCYSQG